MDVENWERDPLSWNATRNVPNLRKAPGKLSRRAYDRILLSAKRYYLEGFGIDWSLFDSGKLVFSDMMTCEATFTHQQSGREIVLSHIWFDEKTGEINQAGSNYGRLEL